MQPGLSAAEDKTESVSAFVSDDVKFTDTGVKGTAEAPGMICVLSNWLFISMEGGEDDWILIFGWLFL